MASSIFLGIPKLDGTVTVKQITSDEDLALKIFADTDDIIETVRLSGVPKTEIKKLISDKDINRHILNIRIQKVKSSAVNPDRVRSIINDTLSVMERKLANGEELTRNEVNLLSLACDVAGAKNQKIDINVRKIESSFASLSDEELDKLIQERKVYIDYRKNLEEDIRLEKIKIPGLTKGTNEKH